MQRHPLIVALLLPAFLLAACEPPPATPAPSESAATANRNPLADGLSIMTYNAEFLWDGIEPEDGSSRMTFPWRGNAAAAAEHMERVAVVIRKADADVVLLQEVEDEAALGRLNAMLEGLGYTPQFIKGKDTFTGQDVAMLSRLEPSRVFRINDQGESGGVSSQVTKNLVATFGLPGGQKLAVLTTHFLARPDAEDRRLKREAQADAIRDAAVDLQKQGHLVLIGGDLNDYDADVPDAAEDLDPISDVLAILKQMDPATPDDDLRNAMERLPQEERRTGWWDRDGNDTISSRDVFTAIDHILLSPELYERVEEVRVPRHDVTEVGDHLPIVVRIDTTY